MEEKQKTAHKRWKALGKGASGEMVADVHGERLLNSPIVAEMDQKCSTSVKQESNNN
jgi:hypothetical protein